MRDVDAEHGVALGRRDEPAGPSGAGSSRRVGALRGPSDGADGARWLRRGASAVGTAALVVAAAAASHYGGEFSDMPALGLGAPVPSVIAKLGRRNDRVLLAPMQHLAYCNLPKAASSTVTTYMTGLNVNIHKFSDVEKFIVERGGDSHFAMVRYSTFHEAGLEHWRNSSAPPYRYFTVVRHPGTRLYSTWFDKIHSHRGADQPDLLYAACDDDPSCSFEEFVDGVTRWLRDEPDVDKVNEHVAVQSDLCDPRARDFDGVFRIEDGFEQIEDALKGWTGVRFDFKSEEGEVGYSHHNKKAKKVYDEFPVSDVKGYEKYMPYETQLKIWRAYKTDFDDFGYDYPEKRSTQRDKCPELPWSEALIQSEWHGEDAQHLDSMPADILDDTPKKSKKVDVPDVPLKLPEELLDFD